MREKIALLTIPSSTLNIEHMNYYKYYKDLRLDELGISSDEEAEELEFELELRFGEFTPRDRKTWLQQNTYLEFFSRIGTVSSAAREAGVTVYKAQTWKFDNVLGFTRRLEVADLAFNDRLKEKALRRASDPKAPATLLIELLRAYIPEEFSRSGHKCDTSKSDEILRRFREDARRELEAGHPTLRKIAEGATNAPPNDDHVPSYSNLSPAGGETQRGGSSHVSPYDAEEAPTHDRPSPTRHTGGGTSPRTPIRGRYPESAPTSEPDHFQDISSSPDTPEDSYHDDYHAEAVRPENYPPFDPEEDLAFFDLTPDGREPSHPGLTPAGRDSHNTNLSPTGRDTSHSDLSPAGGEIQRGGPSRAQRREQLRQQRKAEKKNTFPVVRF